MDFLDFQILFRPFLAAILGAIIGLEREVKGKEAGLRTYSLVCLGACVFTILSFYSLRSLAGETGVELDPSRIIQAVAVGIGFIGAGAILHQKTFVKGLTTAAGLWVVAAIGVAVGMGLYLLASFSTLLSLLILAGLGALEEKFFPEEKS